MSGKITALEFQKKNKDRVSVYLDGRFAFGVPAIVAARLVPGQFLSDADIESLRDDGSVEEAYNRALDYLGYRPRSEAELTAYLRRRDVPDDHIESILSRLKSAGLIDDEAFAQFWVENRERFRPRGLRALRQELRSKGVSSEVIGEALEAVDVSTSAYQAAAKKAVQVRNLERAEFFRKVIEYLARRGFDYGTAREAAERHWTEREADEEPPDL